MLLGAVQQPIQQGLVFWEPMTVMSCNDNPLYNFSPYCDEARLPIVVGYDPEPADLALIPQNIVVQECQKSVITTTSQDVQLRLWHGEYLLGP